MLNPADITLSNLPETLTEAEAWREIARRIEAGQWSEFGLCFEVRQLNRELRTTPFTQSAMFARINEHLRDSDCTLDGDSSPGFWFAPDGEPDQRILLALLFAELAEDGQ